MKLRQKYYFVDYTTPINTAKRVYLILCKKRNDFCILDIIKSLRWGNGITNSNKSTCSPEYKILKIINALNILSQLGILSVEPCEKELHEIFQSISDINIKLTHRITIKKINIDSEYDSIVEASGFSPIKGKKQTISPDMLIKLKNEYKVDYEELITLYQPNKDDEYVEFIKKILPELEYIWCELYSKMSGEPIDEYMLSFEKNGFTTIFDNPTWRKGDGNHHLSEDFTEDRTIGCYGFSSKQLRNRKINDYYMKYDESRTWSDRDTDRGHYIAHAIGGDINANIFPQRRDINRGLSPQGLVYKKIEKHLRDHEGIFCFTRPIYFDFSIRPHFIEFGYITPELHVVVEYFDNV